VGHLAWALESFQVFQYMSDIIQKMKVKAPPLLPILRSATQARLLTALLLDPNREYSLNELAEIGQTSAPTVGREVDRAEEAGIVRTRNVGRTRLVRAHTDSIAYEPLRDLLLAAFGPLAVVGDEFADLDGVQRLFIFGSWAERFEGASGHQPNDVDVLIIGVPDRTAVYEAAERAEAALRRPVQVTIRRAEQWAQPDGDPFLVEIQRRPLVEIDRDVQAAAP
jgi:DNA-binding transcriptional ArsR family regulator